MTWTDDDGIGARCGTARRLTALALIVAVIGLPINHVFGYAVLVVSAIALFAGAVTSRAIHWLAAAAVAGLAVAAQALLAPPPIEEGHNVFLAERERQPLATVLPADVHRRLVQAFEAAYPPAGWCDRNVGGCWRNGRFPETAYAFSADGIYDSPAYSRRVDGIDFSDPVWLRLGFVNDNRYNWTARDAITRVERNRPFWMGYDRWRLMMPWYIVHRFPSAYAGSDLCWRGELLWERNSGQFEARHHAEMACATLTTDDVGRQIFGVAIAPDSLAMRLVPPADIRALALARRGVMLGAVAAVLVLLLRLRVRAAVWPSLLVTLALIVIAIDDASFIGGMRPFDGGDDGLVYDSLGRDILANLLSGDVAAALRGGESVFYYGGPGLRYFRAVEKLIFGESYYGYLSLVLIFPVVLFVVCRRFLPVQWAMAMTLLFVATPLGVIFGTSFFQYATLAARGYADPAAYIFFVCGIVPLLGMTSGGPDNRFAPAFGGALLLALAIFMKPIVAVAAGVLLAGAGLAALYRGQVGRLLGLCLGFLPVLVMPLHNWFFGGVLVPFSANSTHPAVLVMPPGAYAALASDLLQGDIAGPRMRDAAAQIVAWLSGTSQIAALAPLGALAVAVLVAVITGRGRFDPWLRLLAGAALAQHAVALFYIASVPRYHFLAWLLTVIVVTVWFKDFGLPFARRHWPQTWQRAAASGHVLRLSRGLAALQRATGMADRPQAVEGTGT